MKPRPFPRRTLAVDLERLPADRRTGPSLDAEALVARVLHRDAQVLVLDKPAGLAVHAGPTSPDHLELYLEALRFGYAAPPQLAHRLDRDTSGCLALGRNRKGLQRLGRLFESGRAEKTYWAVVDGVPPEPAGVIDAPILKVTDRRGWRMVVDPAGRAAVTEWRVRASDGARAWLELRPRTGRTHQLRVHCALQGWPILGDGFYASGPAREGPLLLHARSLVLPLDPAAPIRAEAPAPPHLAEALAALGA